MSTYLPCPFCRSKNSAFKSDVTIICRGTYRRKFDGRRIQRFSCKVCGKSFSSMTGKPTWRLHKPFINDRLTFLLCSGVSQRRAARSLTVDPKTVARRLPLLAAIARAENARHLAERGPVSEAQFDDMESSIHTKLKPVSIPMVIEKGSREIIAFRVCSMPAKGLLAAKSRKKYGPRPDGRPAARRAVLQALARVAAPEISVLSDRCPQYPVLIRETLPFASHRAVKGRRGCVAGQGELKKIGFDPLFSFNHTAACVRANINRMVRKTWCISKRETRLADHLELYVWFHNHYLIQNPANKKPPGQVPRLRLRP